MIVFGITGGVGTGKSTVTELFAALGAGVLDADQIAHTLMQPRRAVWRKIVRRFGARMLRSDGTIDRARLAHRVFGDAGARRALEAIVHPPVMARIRRQLRQWARSGRVAVAVVDVPLLLETGSQEWVDRVVVVSAPASVAAARLKQRGWSAHEMARRQHAQWDLSAKVALADEVVDNANGMAWTRRQVRRIWTQQQQATRKRPGSISQR